MSPISRPRRFCCQCWAKARSCRCLWFLERYAPDPVTAAVCRLAAQDEARHVAFGMAHLREHIARPNRRPRAADKRGTPAPRCAPPYRRSERRGIRRACPDGRGLVGARRSAARSRCRLACVEDMHRGRTKRLVRLGFPQAKPRPVLAAHAQLHVVTASLRRAHGRAAPRTAAPATGAATAQFAREQVALRIENLEIAVSPPL